MLNKPKYMTPSTKRQECVIDANASEIMFSCIVDGDEAIRAWEIKVYTLVDNALILDTRKQTLGTAFFPITSKNENATFEVDIKKYFPAEVQYFEAGTAYDETKKYYTRRLNSDETTYTYTEYTGNFSSRGNTQLYYKGGLCNSKNAYYWTIDFWGDSTEDSDNTPEASSVQSVFYANSTPTIGLQCGAEYVNSKGETSIGYTVLTDGKVLDSSRYCFRATYSQAESIGIKRYGWRINDIDTDVSLVDTISQNQIYGTKDNIECSYKGFLNDGNYSIELFIETQLGAIIHTPIVHFSVSYALTYLTNDFSVSNLRQESAILLDWREANVICGHIIGNEVKYIENYPIVDYTREVPNTSVAIPASSSIVYDYGSNSGLDISESCCIVLSTQFNDSKNRVVFSAEGVNDSGANITRRLSYSDGYFVYDITNDDGVLKTFRSSSKYYPDKYKWYIISMYPYSTNGTLIQVTESKLKNGLFPRQALYPSESLHPTFGVWDKLKNGG